MKRCPECRRDYYDDTLLYCLDDGNALLEGPATASSGDEPATAILSVPPAIAGGLTGATDETDVKTAILQPPATVGGTDSARGFEKRLLAAPFLLAIIVLGGFFGFRYFKATESGTINSIAVLPFQNKSGDPNSDYLSDGLAESLIYRLSRLSNLKVSPTSSVNQYKGKDTKVTTVANELGVDAVLTGRLTQVGDNFTISVELVDVRNNTLLWGEHYEHKMSELLTTQREIATEITQKLKLRLSGESAQKLAKKYTDSDAAYQIFLKGRYHFGKRTRDDIFKGINYFRQATELDPNFALAYVGMADSYISGTANGYFPRNEGYSNGKAAAQRALEIDPTLAEAHSSLANSLSNGDWNWNEAESEYKTAIELDPNVANSHYYYGLHLQRIGQTNKALAEIKRAVELEPLSLVINSNLAAAYLFDRQYDLALDQAKKIYDLDSNFMFARFWLCFAHSVKGNYNDALVLSENAGPLFLRFIGYSFAKTGQRRKAEETVRKLKEADQPATAAIILGVLGENDRAFEELEKAFADRDNVIARIKIDPMFDPLRDDPRFKRLLKRMNLPE